VTGAIAVPPLVLGTAVLFWVAGFDTLYALQDVDFDRQAGLFSIPSRLGVPAALRLARLFHFLTLVGFALLVPLLGLGALYGAGLLLAAGLLTWEHALLARRGLAKLDVAFFGVNGVLSIVMLVATLADLVLRT
jgi:4-hydroxybenzoate polyprenyltransferase